MPKRHLFSFCDDINQQDILYERVNVFSADQNEFYIDLMYGGPYRPCNKKTWYREAMMSPNCWNDKQSSGSLN